MYKGIKDSWEVYFFESNIFEGRPFDTSAGHGIFASDVKIDSIVSARRVGRAGLFDIPWQSSEGSAITACEGSSFLPNWALEVYDDDNECGIHARNLVPHGHEDFVHIHPRRISSKTDVCDDLAELKFGE
jgi:hypothetical protein